MRSLEQQVADVTRNLEAIRANVKAGHAVVFDDDGTGRGLGSFMVNKTSGEVNVIHDDGSNYVVRRWIIPKAEVPQIVAAMQAQRNPEDFPRQAR